MTVRYDIGPRYEALVRDLVESGRYTDASEVLRDSLRLLEERETQRATRLETLRDEIRIGAESGEGVPADEVFRRLESRYAGPSRD
jgi:antitoxin ParD1/3/4